VEKDPLSVFHHAPSDRTYRRDNREIPTNMEDNCAAPTRSRLPLLLPYCCRSLYVPRPNSKFYLQIRG